MDRRLWLLVPLFFAPFIFCAIFKAFPERRAFFAFLVPTLLTGGLFVESEVLPYLIAMIDLIIVGVLALDFFSLPLRKDQWSVKRETERIVSIRQPHKVTLRVENRSDRKYAYSVMDDIDKDFEIQTPIFHSEGLPKDSAEVFEYEIKPNTRGAFQMEKVFLKIRSRFGFWSRYITLPCETSLHVYPDLQQITQYEIMARTNRLHQLGVRKIRRIGQDNDFERLRDYQQDDNFKLIDWASTAKRQKLTVKDFQASRSQRIVFMIDCGRMMTNETSGGMTLLDHAFNAMLMLCYVAIRQGDAVGLLCFSNKIIRYIPPKPGNRQMNRILHACYDVFAERVESRYDDAFYYLASQCRKRSMVVLISNVTDEVNSDRIERHMTNLVGRHLPIGVLLRDRSLFEAVEPPDGKERDIWRAGAAAEVLNWRHKVLSDLARKGTLTLDTFPEELTAPLINKYLEVKARHLL